ncbi:uncharacterized protein PRCAT00001551001 [Priceomyces carsonii]|uniref:uncharacterized protein n=1 Tax=Priceomyces carsonii TaxID=28549 RepID=UPI002EDAA97A|nr:unnamed protein product [Priceomyces carsonii]
MFDKLKLKSKGSNVPAAAPAATPGKPPSKRQIYQNRQNHGVNIGACFVLEKWIFHDVFPEGAGCELEAVQKLVKEKGKDDAKKKFEKHWNDFLNEGDWKWMKEHHVTSIRVPLGYWDIDGGKFTNGTNFEKFASVYSNAWTIFKRKFIEEAEKYNISVLVDIHGLPFGANGSDHSGEKCSGDAGFWNKEQAQLLVCDMLKFIAKDLKAYDNITGIQIVNEAEFADPPKKQQRYYAAAISKIREEDLSIPIIISDGWWPDQWVKWVQDQQSEGKSIGVVIDDHCYRCFSDDDKKKSPRQIINDLEKDLLTNLTDNGNGVDFMVGEYSCVIDGSSWNKDNANTKRDDYVIQYGRREIELMSKRATFGTYFWTFKFQSGNGGEWDFKTMTDSGAISPAVVVNKIPDSSQRDQKLNSAYSAHVEYWNKQNSKEKYEHERYKEGFNKAWDDATAFAKFNGSVIGRIQAWKAARFDEHVKSKGSLKHLWEWEQGFQTGLNEFLNCV